jgi:hypothetical protein
LSAATKEKSPRLVLSDNLLLFPSESAQWTSFGVIRIQIVTFWSIGEHVESIFTNEAD